MSKGKRSLIRWGSIGLALLAVAAVVLTASAPQSYGDAKPRFVRAPLNPDYVRFINDKQAGRPWPTRTAEGHPLSLIPPPDDLPHYKLAPDAASRDAYPIYYDLRTKNKLTSVKDQGSCGSCWSFSTFGSLESLLKPGTVWDFSEQHLIDNHGLDYGPCDGGHYKMSAAYLARWGGPVLETFDPYQYASRDGALPLKKHVQEIIFSPVRTSATDNNRIKDLVTKYGAVSISMAWDSSSWNQSTNSYYYRGSSWVGGHAVCVVGWDDNYSKSKFRSTAPGNGAFIVKNSWGTGWGAKGYFYASYHDTMFARANCNFVVKGEPTTNYKSIYDYDPLGWCGSWGTGSSPTCWMANIFTAKANESLKAVSFYCRGVSNKYEIYIYTKVASGKPRGGTLKGTKKGTIKSPGYFTVPLNALVPLVNGQKFSIVVKLTSTQANNYPIAAESRLTGYSSGAKASSGQSYLSANGTAWDDFAKYDSTANVCLKGFTK